MIVSAEVEVVAAYVTAVLSPAIVQAGALAYAVAKLAVQLVMVPVPTVIFPAVSLPVTLGLVPHELSVGSVPEVVIGPANETMPVPRKEKEGLVVALPKAMFSEVLLVLILM